MPRHNFGNFTYRIKERDAKGKPVKVHIRVKDSALVEGQEDDGYYEDGLADVEMREDQP